MAICMVRAGPAPVVAISVSQTGSIQKARLKTNVIRDITIRQVEIQKHIEEDMKKLIGIGDKIIE